jgi:putative transposase
MYRWRGLSEKQRQELLEFRRHQLRPWHSPPHFVGSGSRYLLSAACYEHHAHIAQSTERMASFSDQLVAMLESFCERVAAWCVLPNHYHALVHTHRLVELLTAVGRLHGRTSRAWNLEENRQGRKVWFNCAETAMKSDRHYWATLNYVHHNPVHHRYVEHWQDWPFSSAAAYLETVGTEAARRTWKTYPVLDYGKEWDPPES